ncbi:MAG: hypothetical protein Q9213_000221 [Squamulea squamosa]
MSNSDVDPVFRINEWGFGNERDLEIYNVLSGNKHKYADTKDWEKLRPLLDEWKEHFEAVMDELSKEEVIEVPDVTNVSYTPYGQGVSEK